MPDMRNLSRLTVSNQTDLAISVTRESLGAGLDGQVDGQPTRVLRANGRYAGSGDPQGRHEVVLDTSRRGSSWLDADGVGRRVHAGSGAATRPGRAAAGVRSAAMSACLLDGAATARAMLEELRGEITALAARGIQPGLHVLLVGDDPASAVYVRSKTRACESLGLRHQTTRLPADVTTAAVLAQVEDCNRRTTCTASWCSFRFHRRWTRLAC